MEQKLEKIQAEIMKVKNLVGEMRTHWKTSVAEKQ